MDTYIILTKQGIDKISRYSNQPSMIVWLQIFGQPSIWSTSDPTFMLGSASLFHLMISGRLSGTGSPVLQQPSSSVQTYWIPVCLQLQRMVRQDGNTTIGSPFTMNLLVFPPVIESKWLAQSLFPTLGAPQVMTLMSGNTLAWLMSMQEMTDRPPPREIPVIWSCLMPVWSWMSLRSPRTQFLMLSHMLLYAFWTLQVLQVCSSTIWLAQRISCQTFNAVLVYLKAKTTKVGQTERTHLISLADSQMQCAWSGLFVESQTLHSQFKRSCMSSRPTKRELARVICSTYGRETMAQTSAHRITSFMIRNKIIH